MNKYITYCLWILLLVSCIATGFLLNKYPTVNNFYFTFGIIFLDAVPISFVLGIVLCFFKKYRLLGLALLTVAALSGLIGLGLCSQYTHIRPLHQ